MLLGDRSDPNHEVLRELLSIQPQCLFRLDFGLELDMHEVCSLVSSTILGADDVAALLKLPQDEVLVTLLLKPINGDPQRSEVIAFSLRGRRGIRATAATCR